MPSAWAVTRYGPPTRNPVAENWPDEFVVTFAVVPDGTCTIVTVAPGDRLAVGIDDIAG